MCIIRRRYWQFTPGLPHWDFTIVPTKVHIFIFLVRMTVPVPRLTNYELTSQPAWNIVFDTHHRLSPAVEHARPRAVCLSTFTNQTSSYRIRCYPTHTARFSTNADMGSRAPNHRQFLRPPTLKRFRSPRIISSQVPGTW